MHNMCVLQYCLEKIIGEKKMFLSGDEKKTLYRHYGKKTKNKKIIVYSSHLVCRLLFMQSTNQWSNIKSIYNNGMCFFIFYFGNFVRRSAKPKTFCMHIDYKQTSKKTETNKQTTKRH